ncbi:MAG: 1,4-alpha-glucan branching protein domain-containing protein [Candidatus Heimdallarchaeaceae archaeon]
MVSGFLNFVLHGHLPWVLAQGTWPHGEVWLHEAAAETYCPTLSMLTDLYEKKGYTEMLTIGLTPVLCEQLIHPRFKAGFVTYLENRIEGSFKDKDHFNWIGEHDIAKLAERWANYYTSVKEQFLERFHSDLVAGYRSLQENNAIEIISSGITHGYLPLLGKDEMVNAQIRAGQRIYEKHFGRNHSIGIWLPELAYRPTYRWKNPLTGEEFDRKGIEFYLQENKIKYFIVDTPLLRGGKGIGAYLERFDALKMIWKQYEKEKPAIQERDLSIYRPYYITDDEELEKRVSFYTRDDRTGILVWSGDIGFPGDEWYLEFHKKHWPSGNRYWRITGPNVDLGEKKVYNDLKIVERLDENSEYFFKVVKEILLENQKSAVKPNVIVSPYDFELFGHWWFEGIGFLERILTFVSEDEEISLTTGSKYLQTYPPEKENIVSLPEGSWGEGNFHWIWLNQDTQWCWRYIYECEKIYLEVLKIYREKYHEDFELMTRIINQMGRELFLLSSSDWEFLISTWGARDYAESRVLTHYENFKLLYSFFKEGLESQLSEKQKKNLRKIEEEDSIAWNMNVQEWF